MGFAPHVDYAADDTPISVGTSDFNLDGLLDLAVGNASGNVDILLGNGDGSFRRGSTVQLGVVINSMAISDFNVDGLPDIAAATLTEGAVVVVFGADGGGFVPLPSPAAFGTQPISLVALALGGTMAESLAFIDRNGPGISVLPNPGNGMFGLLGSMTQVGNPLALGVGDLNGDGEPDPVATIAPGSVEVLISPGAFPFNPPIVEAVGSPVGAVATGDFNGDQQQDVAVAEPDGGTVAILLGSGNGDLTLLAQLPAGPQPASLASGIFGGNAKVDLAVANLSASTVSVLVGDGSGTFRALIPLATGEGPDFVAVADLNHDGWPDLVTANGAAGTISVLLNAQCRNEPAVDAGPPDAGPPDAGAADAGPSDAGPVTQVVVVSLEPPFLVAQSACGSVEAPCSATLTFAVENLDGEGLPGYELAIGSDGGVTLGVSSTSAVTDQNGQASVTVTPVEGGGGGTIAALDAQGAYAYALVPLLPPCNGAEDYCSGVCTDLTTSAHCGSCGRVCTGGMTCQAGTCACPDGGSPEWNGMGPAYVLSTVSASCVVTADINGDGLSDLALCTNASADGGGAIALVLAGSDGGFGLSTIIPTGHLLDAIAVGDFDGNGLLDFAVGGNSNGPYGGSSGSGFTVVLQAADGGWNPVVYSADAGVDCLAAGDLNGDGRPDLIFNTVGSLLVLLNQDGTGFGAPRQYPGAFNSALIADFDGDGLPDIGYSGALTGILPNLGDGGFGPSAVAWPTGGKLAAGDFNGDGALDAAFAVGSEFTELLNQGGFAFAYESSPSSFSLYGSASIAASDFDGDGLTDLAGSSTNWAAQGQFGVNLGIWLGSEDAGLQSLTLWPIPALRSATAMAVGDFNADGRPDLVVGYDQTSSAPGTVGILLNLGNTCSSP